MRCNLHESGVNVVVGLYPGSKSWAKVEAAGLRSLTVAEATQSADVIMILTPDIGQAKLYREEIGPHLKAGKTLMFAHGFNIRYGQIVPPDRCGCEHGRAEGAGPSRARDLCRRAGRARAARRVPGCQRARPRRTRWPTPGASAARRAGVLETTFKEETETDLFGEQAVLCGGASALVKAGFDTLVEAGYQPEIAYFECLHELKLIVDLMYQGGLSYMRYSVSDTAEHGDYTAGPKIVTDETRADDEARSWPTSRAAPMPRSGSRKTPTAGPISTGGAETARNSKLEQVGRDLRRMMPWLNPKEVSRARG